MGLHIVRNTGEGLVGEAATEALRVALGRAGSAVLLLPSLEQALGASRRLAAERSLSLGVSAGTVASWSRERWEAYGDGRAPVDAATRLFLVGNVVAQAALEGWLGTLDSGAGTVRLVADAARDALAWLPHGLPDDPHVAHGLGLSDAERVAVRLMRAYAECLRARNLVEPCEVLRELPARLPLGTPPVVACLDSPNTYSELRFIVGLSRVAEVTCSVRVGAGAASELAEGFLNALCGLVGTPVPVATAPEGEAPEPVPPRAPELQSFLGSLFRANGDRTRPPKPEGAVSLMLPAGPAAEAELVAQGVSQLAAQGVRDVVVVSPDASSTWEELAPKLARRGVGAKVSLSPSLLDTEAGRAFAAFCQGVARLAVLARDWPPRAPINDDAFDARAELADGPVPPGAPLEVDAAGLANLGRKSLGEMAWWPPRDVVDFLLSDLSGVPRAHAWDLDARWRGNRVLSPADVLATLRKSSVTSPACAEAVQQLVERGSVAGAARALARPLQAPPEEGTAEIPNPAARELAVSVLQSFASLAQTAARAGLRNELEGGDLPLVAPPESSAPGYVDLLLGVASATRVPVRRRLGVGSPCEVSVLSPAEASRLPPASASALIYLGLDTQRSPVPHDDSALGALLAKLGASLPVTPLALSRRTYLSCVSVARDRLVLERAEHDAGSSETFPAVMLTESLACYDEPRSLPVARRGEDLVGENLAASGVAPRAISSHALPAAGALSEASRRYVTVPNNGARSEGGELLLSATQLETYLDCPLKWFVTRRVGLEAPDANFSNLEMGGFAHRVLELTHLRLLSEAFAQAHPQAEGRCVSPPWDDPAFNPLERLPGSRVDAANLDRALGLLDTEFVRHLSHQYQAATRRGSRGLIPHVPSERYELKRLRDDLASALAYEAGLFQGFEPRYFELPFGRAGMRRVLFAGAVLNGTIDRVDVDDQGNAIVVDYKHRSRLFDEYALFGRELAEGDADADFELPRHVQTLVYARALRQLLPQLNVVGVVYLGTRANHDLSGAVERSFAERVFGGEVPESVLERVAVPGEAAAHVGVRDFNGLLDRAEEQLTQVVARMGEGHIEASPRGGPNDRRFAYVCEWCPVQGCERRRG